MAYGKIKADAVIWDNSGTDVEESMSNIAGKLNKAGDAMTGNLTLNAQNELRLADSDSSHHVALKAPATVAANRTWTLPSAAPTAGQMVEFAADGTISYRDAPQGYIESEALYTNRLTSSINQGGNTAATWNVVPINTEDWDPDNIASVANNEITIPNAGTYIIRWQIGTNFSNGFQIALLDTNNAVIKAGGRSYCSSSYCYGDRQAGWYKVTQTGSVTYRLGLFPETAYSYGLGHHVSNSISDVFDHFVHIYKLVD